MITRMFLILQLVVLSARLLNRKDKPMLLRSNLNEKGYNRSGSGTHDISIRSPLHNIPFYSGVAVWI